MFLFTFASSEFADTSVVAAIVASNGAKPNIGSIGAFLRDAGLRTQALPERVDIVDALPRNPAGKVLKRELQEKG